MIQVEHIVQMGGEKPPGKITNQSPSLDDLRCKVRDLNETPKLPYEDAWGSP